MIFQEENLPRLFFMLTASLALALTACASATPAQIPATRAPTQTRAASASVPTPVALPTATPAVAALDNLAQSVTPEGHYALGRVDAPVTLIDYSDFM
jgi:ABC-type Fe3+-hydroxamate transport system substrate-binding protein